jgi:flagellum-specific ATP synthase
MDSIVSKQHLQSAQRMRQLYSAYRQQRDLIAVGAYQKGSDPRVDEAIALWPEISAFLQQSVDQRAGLADSLSRLDQVLAGTAGLDRRRSAIGRTAPVSARVPARC